MLIFIILVELVWALLVCRVFPPLRSNPWLIFLFISLIFLSFTSPSCSFISYSLIIGVFLLNTSIWETKAWLRIFLKAFSLTCLWYFSKVFITSWVLTNVSRRTEWINIEADFILAKLLVNLLLCIWVRKMSPCLY